MSETNGHSNGKFMGGQGEVTRSDLKLANTAIRNEYQMTPEIRQNIIGQAHTILMFSDSERWQLLAAKVLLTADSINVKREAVRVQERQTDVMEATAGLREAMKSPEVRKMLVAFSDQVCSPVKAIEDTNGKPHDAAS
jgi:hypothetical protein